MPTPAQTGHRHHLHLLHLPHLVHRVTATAWAEIHRLHYQDGRGIGDIARMVHLPRRTVRKILSPWN
jgi:DNA-binding transcriptional regulator LsrR (DeoR family)